MQRIALPRGFRQGFDGDIACPHRDLSVCPTCALEHQPEIVESFGRHYWVTDPAERTELARLESKRTRRTP